MTQVFNLLVGHVSTVEERRDPEEHPQGLQPKGLRPSTSLRSVQQVGVPSGSKDPTSGYTVSGLQAGTSMRVLLSFPTTR